MAAVCQTGYLDVKIPSKSRGLKNWKTWKKRWVVLSSADLSLVGPPTLVVQIYSHHSQKDKNCLFWKTFSSRLCQVYRSRSRTHRHAFSLAQDDGPLLHLAGASETQSQDWMAAIRDLLWPPSPLIQLKTAYRGSHRVSLIDNDFSCQTGMLGRYGHLSIEGHQMTLSSPDSGRILAEWPLSSVKRYQLVPQVNQEDAYKVFSLIISHPHRTSGQLQFYSVESMSILQQLSRATRAGGPVESLLDAPLEEVDLIQFDDYHPLPQNGATTDDELEDQRHSLGSSGSTGTQTPDSGGYPPWPDRALNCSLNSTSSWAPEADDDSLSPPSSPLLTPLDDFDFLGPPSRSFDSHLYADLDSASSDHDCLYEELDQYAAGTPARETVPPLPPRNIRPPVNQSATGLPSHLFRSVVRTESVPVLGAACRPAPSDTLSSSAPETGEVVPRPPFGDFRQRSQTDPIRLRTEIAELNRVHYQHKRFKRLIKAMSEENLRVGRWPSDTLRPKEERDPLYIDMNGVGRAEAPIQSSVDS